MTAGTRVRHTDGATGTVVGTVRYVTGHTVPQVRWDDRDSARVGAVVVINETGEQA